MHTFVKTCFQLLRYFSPQKKKAVWNFAIQTE